MCLLESADFLAAPFWQLAALALRALAFRFGVLRIPRFELRPRGREDFDRFPAMGAEIRRTTSLTNVVTDVIRTCRPAKGWLNVGRAAPMGTYRNVSLQPESVRVSVVSTRDVYWVRLA